MTVNDTADASALAIDLTGGTALQAGAIYPLMDGRVVDGCRIPVPQGLPPDCILAAAVAGDQGLFPLLSSRPAFADPFRTSAMRAVVTERLCTLLVRAAQARLAAARKSSGALESGLKDIAPPKGADTAPSIGTGGGQVQRIAARLSEALGKRIAGPWQWMVLIRRVDEITQSPPDAASLAGRWKVLDPGPDKYAADPCLAAVDGRVFCFYESFDYTLGRGRICVRQISDAPGPELVALEQPFHLSYPMIVRDEQGWAMVAEANAGGALTLYRTDAFPLGWRPAATILAGTPYADPTIFFWQGRWWLLVASGEPGVAVFDELMAFHAPRLEGPWTAHPLNPLLSDVCGARPAGPILQRGGRLYRPGQDCRASYGAAMSMQEIQTIDCGSYTESTICRIDPRPWGFHGLHAYAQAGGFEAIDLKARRGRVLQAIAAGELRL